MSIVLLGDVNTCVSDEVVENLIGRRMVPGKNLIEERMIGLCLERGR